MSHDIESNFIADYWNEDKHCSLCDSFECASEKCICKESETEVKSNDHCDFFRAKD